MRNVINDLLLKCSDKIHFIQCIQLYTILLSTSKLRNFMFGEFMVRFIVIPFFCVISRRIAVRNTFEALLSLSIDVCPI